jgi:Zn-dependent M32 family carboxypeptidase
MINYGLGAMLTADIRKRIRACIGPFDAGNPRWYAWTSAHLLRYGASIGTRELLRQFLGRPVSPDALLEQLRRGVPGRDLAGGGSSMIEVAHECFDEAALE